MSGTALTQPLKIDYDDHELRKKVFDWVSRTRDLTPVMETWGSIGRTSVVENFEDGGRPEKWQPAKDGGRTLFRKGFAGGLAGSVNYKAAQDHVILGTNKVYGAIHQFGGQAGRGLKTTIPARPYLVVQDEDVKEMQAALMDFVLGGE